MGTKEQIIDTAMKLFSEKGFEATSVRDIANSANVNVALINYHFGSKEGLLKEIIETRAKLMQVRIKEISADKAMTEIDKINSIIEHYVDKFFSHHAFHRVIFLEISSSQRELIHKDALDIFSTNSNLVAQIIKAGIAKKLFKKVDAELCFSNIIGPLQYIMNSKELRIKLFSQNGEEDPITDQLFKHRITKHIQQMMNDFLMAEKINK